MAHVAKPSSGIVSAISRAPTAAATFANKSSSLATATDHENEMTAALQSKKQTTSTIVATLRHLRDRLRKCRKPLPDGMQNEDREQGSVSWAPVVAARSGPVGAPEGDLDEV